MNGRRRRSRRRRKRSGRRRISGRERRGRRRRRREKFGKEWEVEKKIKRKSKEEKTVHSNLKKCIHRNKGKMSTSLMSMQLNMKFVNCNI